MNLLLAIVEAPELTHVLLIIGMIIVSLIIFGVFITILLFGLILRRKTIELKIGNTFVSIVCIACGLAGIIAEIIFIIYKLI